MSSLAPYQDARDLITASGLLAPENISWANENFEEPDDEIFIAVEAQSHALDPLDIGAGRWVEEGRIVIYCLAPSGSGTDALRTLAKNLANLFRTASSTTRNPRYGEASIGMGGEAQTGNYYVIPVTVNFRYED